jgi:hypothetical protein
VKAFSSPILEPPAIHFWAAALRSVALDGTCHTLLNQVPVPAPSMLAAPREQESWDLLAALSTSIDGPPTPAQLALFAHLAPHSGRITPIQ